MMTMSVSFLTGHSLVDNEFTRAFQSDKVLLAMLVRFRKIRSHELH